MVLYGAFDNTENHLNENLKVIIPSALLSNFHFSEVENIWIELQYFIP